MTESQDNTIQLLRGWRGGDRSALHELIEENLPWIGQHVRRRLGDGLRRVGETQDFVQAAMVHVLEYGPRFEVADREHFRRILARIIENTLREQHRRMHRQKRDIDQESPGLSETILRLDPPQKEVTRPSQLASQDEQVAWVRLALEFLPPQDREVLWLHEYEGLTFPQIAEQLDSKEATVRMRFHRALPKLAKKVAELQKGQLDEVLGAEES